jgi:hypothetical protein
MAAYLGPAHGQPFGYVDMQTMDQPSLYLAQIGNPQAQDDTPVRLDLGTLARVPRAFRDIGMIRPQSVCRASLSIQRTASSRGPIPSRVPQGLQTILERLCPHENVGQSTHRHPLSCSWDRGDL